MEDRIWTLLARHCTGEATAAEEQELGALLAQDPALKNAAQKIIASWHIPEQSDAHKAFQAFNRLDARIQEAASIQAVKEAPIVTMPHRPFLHRYRMLLSGAAAVIFLVAAWWVWQGISKPDSTAYTAPQQEIAALPGSIRKIKLPDGSLVWLNEGSKMGYNHAFNNSLREVWLTGEA